MRLDHSYYLLLLVFPFLQYTQYMQDSLINLEQQILIITHCSSTTKSKSHCENSRMLGYFSSVQLSFKVTLTQDLGSVRRWDPFKESSDRLLPHRAWMQSCMRSSPRGAFGRP